MRYPWVRREDQKAAGPAAGIRFVMHERRAPNVRAEVAGKKTKAQVDGTAALTLAFGQYKYGDELIAQVYSLEPAKRSERRADGYYRVQIFLGTADWDTAATLEAIAAEIRKRLA